MARLGTAVLELRTDNAPLAAGLRSAEATTKASSRRLGEITAAGAARAGTAMNTLGRNWTRAVSLPLAAGAAAAIKFASDFQGSMEKIHTQAGASTAEVNKMSAAILRLAPQLGQTPKGLSDALFHVESEGFRGAKALDIMTQAAKLAAIGGADLETTVNGVVSVMQAAPKDIHSATDAIGLMNAIVGTGNMRLADLNAAMPNVMTTAVQFGLGMRDVGASLDIMTGRGMGAAESATRLGMALRLMAAPTDKAKKQLADIGLNANNLALDFRKPDGLVVAIRDLKSHMDAAGLSATEQGQLITRAFGARSSQAILLMTQHTDDLQKRFDEIGQRSGAGKVAEEWGKAQHTMEFQFRQIRAQAATTAIEIGTKLGPTIIGVARTAATDAEKLATAFKSLPGWAQHAIVTGGLLAIAFGPAMRVAGVVTLAAGRLIQAASFAARLLIGKEVLGIGGAGGGGIAGKLGGRAVQTVATMEVGTLIAKSAIGGVGGSKIAGTSTGGMTTGVAAAEASTLSRAVTGAMRGGLFAVIGVTLSQVVGSAIGKGTGEGVKRIGTDASIGAGLGTAIGSLFKMPMVGAGIGLGLGALYGLFAKHGISAGQKYAEGFVKGVADPHRADVQRAVKKQGETYDQAVDQLSKSAVHSRTPYMSILLQGAPGRGVIPLAAAKRFVDATQRTLETAFRGAKAIPTGVLLGDFQSRLRQTPAQFKQLAAQSMLQFTSELYSKGKISQQQFTRVIKDLEKQFPGLAQSMGYYGGLTAKNLADSFKLTLATRNLHSALAGYKSAFHDAQVDSTAQGTLMWKNMGVAMAKLRDEMKNGTAAGRKAATAEYNKLQQATSSTLDAMLKTTRDKTGQIVHTLGAGSKQAVDTASSNFGKLSSNIYAAMAGGSISTGQGVKLIGEALNTALKLFGEKALQIPSIATMSSTIKAVQLQQGQMTSGGAHFARGGLVQFGREGDRGDDSMAVNFGGLPIKVGRGEQGLVLTGDQQAFLNERTADVGGLPGVFRRLRRPHAQTRRRRYATGGVVLDPGVQMTEGREPQILADLYRLAAELRNTVYVISGYRSPAHSVAVGGFADDPHTRGEAADIGIGGPSRASMFGVQESQLRAVGLFRPFYPASAAEVNHVQLAAGGAKGPGVFMPSAWKDIKAPGVTGTGTTSAIVRAALGLAVKAANKYGASKAGPVGGVGAVGGTGSITAANLQAIAKSLGYNWSGSDISNWLRIISQESGGNPTAQNPTSTAYGIGQFLDCVPLEAECLTREGWKTYDQVAPGVDETLGINPDSGMLEWTPILGVVVKPSRPLERISVGNWSADVTPGHRWWSERRMVEQAPQLTECPVCSTDSGKRGLFTSPRAVQTHVAKKHRRLAGRGSYRRRKEFVRTAEITKAHRLQVAAIAKTGENRAISEDEAAIIGWIQGEGCIRHTRGLNVTIYQAKPDRVAVLKALLKDVPHSLYVRERPNGTWPEHAFYLRAEYARDLLARSQMEELSPEEFVLSLSSKQRSRWLEAIIQGEGSSVASGISGNEPIVRVTQNAGPLADAIMLAAYLEGNRPTRRPRERREPHHKPAWTITLGRPYIGSTHLKHEELGEQPVWCINTGLGTWTMRQHGLPMLTGNSTWGLYGTSAKTSDPHLQLVDMAKYIKGKYGTPTNAEAVHLRINSYARGGFIPAATGLSPYSGWGSQWVGPRTRQKAPTQKKHKHKSGPTFAIPKDIADGMAALDAILGDTGAVAVLQDRYTSTDSLFQAEHPDMTYVVTEDAAGNPVTPYIDWNAVNLSLTELYTLQGWEQSIINYYKGALAMIGPLLKSIGAEADRRRKQVAFWRARIRANMQAVTGIQHAVSESGKQSTNVDKLSKLLQVLGVEHDRLPNTEAAHPARLKIRELIAQIRDYAKSHDAKSTLGKKFPEGAVHDLKDVNERLGGDRDKVGTAGYIGGALAEIGTLETDYQTVSEDQTTIGGPSGVGGALNEANIAMIDLNRQIGQLAPNVLAAELAKDQAAGAGASTDDSKARLAELIAQQNELLAKTAALTASEEKVWASLITSPLPGLPPWGGTFGGGGTVPGMLGQPVMIEAHGGEVVTPPGLPIAETHVSINGKGVALEKLIDVAVDRKMRQAARGAGRRMPSAGGGVIR